MSLDNVATSLLLGASPPTQLPHEEVAAFPSAPACAEAAAVPTRPWTGDDGPFALLANKDLSRRRLSIQERTWLAQQIAEGRHTVAEFADRYSLKRDTLRLYKRQYEKGHEFHEKGGRPMGVQDSKKRKTAGSRADARTDGSSSSSSSSGQHFSNDLSGLPAAAFSSGSSTSSSNASVDNKSSYPSKKHSPSSSSSHSAAPPRRKSSSALDSGYSSSNASYSDAPGSNSPVPLALPPKPPAPPMATMYLDTALLEQHQQLLAHHQERHQREQEERRTERLEREEAGKSDD